MSDFVAPDCCVKGCSRPIRSRGLCNGHYQTWLKKNSDAVIVPPVDSSRWTDEQIAWVAGLLEGEGNFFIRHGGQDCRIQLKMTDEDVIIKVGEILGCGHVTGPWSNGAGNKPVWSWNLTRSSHLVVVLNAIAPFLCSRRRVAANLIWQSFIDRGIASDSFPESVVPSGSSGMAWVAGVFEGEGCISSQRGRPIIVVGMTDYDVIERLHLVTGLGTINGPHSGRPGTKQNWKWNVCKKQSIVLLLKDIATHFGKRRRSRTAEVMSDSPALVTQ